MFVLKLKYEEIEMFEIKANQKIIFLESTFLSSLFGRFYRLNSGCFYCLKLHLLFYNIILAKTREIFKLYSLRGLEVGNSIDRKIFYN